MLAHLTHWPKLTRPGKKHTKGATSSHSTSSLKFERSSSGQTPKKTTSSSQIEVAAFATLPKLRARAQTYSPEIHNLKCRAGSSVSLTPDDVYKTEPENMQMTFSSPRHFMRRRALGQSELQGDLNCSKLAKQSSLEDNMVSVTLEDERGIRMKDTTVAKEVMTLRERLDFLFIKNNVFLSHDLDDYHITATNTTGSSIPVDLDAPSTRYVSYHIAIKPGRKKGATNETEKNFQTVQDCLDYFDVYGLVELPLNSVEDEDSYRLPRVQPLEPIAGSWSELPISVHLKNSLDHKELKRQQAIWELISTEHSHLRQLETIINLFMQCLELIRRAEVLSEDGYHNMFGYMEEIYHAHEQFWTWTLEPCLDKVYKTGELLDVNIIIDRFPVFGSHFEMYGQHCALEKINLRSLKEASQNQDFLTYLKWCEAHPECNRQKLRAFLVIPMQRLTKYPLLIKAISSETNDLCIKQRLAGIWEEIHEFVQSVNSDIRVQEETERVRDVMNRITAYNVVDIPSEFKELIHKYTHLDLLAPMPNVEVDKSRVLMLEGNLKYRDNINTRMMVVHVFLFTDMLLITKPYRRGLDKYTVVKQVGFYGPYKITSLVLYPLEAGSFCVVVLNEFYVVVSWFVLKANSPEVAEEWRDQINAAQQFYKEAVEKKEQNSQLLQNLRSERILDGIDPSLCASLSQSLISINSYGNGRPWNTGLSGSIESFLSIDHRNSLESNHLPLSRTRSADPESHDHKRSTPSISCRVAGSADCTCAVSSLALSSASPKYTRSLERASSLGRLLEQRGESNMVTISESNLLSTSFNKPQRSISQGSRSDLKDVEELSESESPIHKIDSASPALHHLGVSSQGSTVSLVSDDSGTESGESPIGDSFPVRKLPIPVCGDENRHEVVVPVKSGDNLSLSNRSRHCKNGSQPFQVQREKLVCDFDVKNPDSDLPCFQASQSQDSTYNSSLLKKSGQNSTRTTTNFDNSSLKQNNLSRSVHHRNHLVKLENIVESTLTESVSFVSPKHTIISVPSPDRKVSNESDNQLQTDSSPTPNLQVVECKILKTNKFEGYSGQEDKKHQRSLSEPALPATFRVTYLVPSTINQQSSRLSPSSLIEDDRETTEEDSSSILKSADSNSLSAEGDEEEQRLSATSSCNSISSSSDTPLVQCDSIELETKMEGSPTETRSDIMEKAGEFENHFLARSDVSPHSSPPQNRSKSSLSKYDNSGAQYRDEALAKISSKSVPASPSRNHQSSHNTSPQNRKNITPVHERIAKKSVRELLQMFESKENNNANSESSSPTHQPPAIKPSLSLSPLRQHAKMVTAAENGTQNLNTESVPQLEPPKQQNEVVESSSARESIDVLSSLNPPSKASATDFIAGEKPAHSNPSRACSNTNSDAKLKAATTQSGSKVHSSSTQTAAKKKSQSIPPCISGGSTSQPSTGLRNEPASVKSQNRSKNIHPPSVSAKPVRRPGTSPKSTKCPASTNEKLVSEKTDKVGVQNGPAVSPKLSTKAHTKHIQVTSHAVNSTSMHTPKSNSLHAKHAQTTTQTAKAPGNHPSGSHSVTWRCSKASDLNDSTSHAPRKASTSSVAMSTPPTSNSKSVKKSPMPKRNSVIATNKVLSPSSSPSTSKRVTQGSAKSPKSVPKLFVQHSEDKKSTKIETKKMDSPTDLSPFSRESSRPVRKRKVTPSHRLKFQVSSSSCPSSPATRHAPQRQTTSLNSSPVLPHCSNSKTEGKESPKLRTKQVGSPKVKPPAKTTTTTVTNISCKTSIELNLNSNTNNNNDSGELIAYPYLQPQTTRQQCHKFRDRTIKPDLSPLLITHSFDFSKEATCGVNSSLEAHHTDVDSDNESLSPCLQERSSTIFTACMKMSKLEHKTSCTRTVTPYHNSKILRAHSVDCIDERTSGVDHDVSPEHCCDHPDTECVVLSAPSYLRHSPSVPNVLNNTHTSSRELTSGLSTSKHKNKRSPHEWQNFGLSWSHQQLKATKGRPQLQRMNSASLSSYGFVAAGDRGRRGAISPL